jgi:heat shock 70kDa protein 1/2/6/8
MSSTVTETSVSTSHRFTGLAIHSHLPAVANEQGSFTTPSFVSFTEEERLIGEAAKNQAAMNPRNTVFDIKSVLPLRITDCSIREAHPLTFLKTINRTKI